MSERNKLKEKTELELSYKAFDKILKFTLVFAIVLVSGFIIFYILNPEPGHVSFGVLNENKKAEDYPTSAQIDEEIYFYATVDNHLSTDFTFKLKILKGDNDTLLSSTGSDKAQLYSNSEVVTLTPGGKWMSEKQTISFSQEGNNQIIIVELWEIKEDGSEEFFNILWIRLNIIG